MGAAVTLACSLQHWNDGCSAAAASSTNAVTGCLHWLVVNLPTHKRTLLIKTISEHNQNLQKSAVPILASFVVCPSSEEVDLQ